jgi:two-component system NarL family sensor kinase
MSSRLVLLLNDAVGKTRRLSHGLYAAELDEGALVPMLASLAQHLESTAPIAVDFSVTGEHFDLERTQALHLYRIVQEATSNVVRHSGANALSLHIHCRRGVLRILIEDNGVGIELDSEGRHNGIGVHSMRSRAELIVSERCRQVVRGYRFACAFNRETFQHDRCRSPATTLEGDDRR